MPFSYSSECQPSATLPLRPLPDFSLAGTGDRGRSGLATAAGEERNVQDLQHDIAESKKLLNARMLELQKLSHEIKVRPPHAARARQ